MDAHVETEHVEHQVPLTPKLTFRADDSVMKQLDSTLDDTGILTEADDEARLSEKQLGEEKMSVEYLTVAENESEIISSNGCEMPEGPVSERSVNDDDSVVVTSDSAITSDHSERDDKSEVAGNLSGSEMGLSAENSSRLADEQSTNDASLVITEQQEAENSGDALKYEEADLEERSAVTENTDQSLLESSISEELNSTSEKEQSYQRLEESQCSENAPLTNGTVDYTAQESKDQTLASDDSKEAANNSFDEANLSENKTENDKPAVGSGDSHEESRPTVEEPTENEKIVKSSMLVEEIDSYVQQPGVEMDVNDPNESRPTIEEPEDDHNVPKGGTSIEELSSVATETKATCSSTESHPTVETSERTESAIEELGPALGQQKRPEQRTDVEQRVEESDKPCAEPQFPEAQPDKSVEELSPRLAEPDEEEVTAKIDTSVSESCPSDREIENKEQQAACSVSALEEQEQSEQTTDVEQQVEKSDKAFAQPQFTEDEDRLAQPDNSVEADEKELMAKIDTLASESCPSDRELEEKASCDVSALGQQNQSEQITDVEQRVEESGKPFAEPQFTEDKGQLAQPDKSVEELSAHLAEPEEKEVMAKVDTSVSESCPSDRELEDKEHQASCDMSVEELGSDVSELNMKGDVSLSDKSMEELCATVKEPEEEEHQAKCELLQHEHHTTRTPESGKAKEDDWLYVLGNDKLKKRILRAGLDNARPHHGQLVTVRCCGRLHNGNEIDKHDSLELVLGDGDFVQAFDLCLPLMDKHELAEVVSDAQFAYGELGRQPDVPPNANVTYELELLDCRDQPRFSSLPISERVKMSNQKRERGNFLYSRNDCSRAINVYLKAIEIANDDNESHTESPAELQLLVDTRVTCYNNLAAAQLKMEAWDAVIRSCDQVLRVQPNNVKALFRKGKALISKGDYDAAIGVLRRATKLEPENKAIQQELNRLEKKNTEQKKTQKELYQKMLGTKDSTPQNKNESSKSWKWFTAAAAVAAIASASVVAYRRLSHI